MWPLLVAVLSEEPSMRGRVRMFLAWMRPWESSTSLSMSSSSGGRVDCVESSKFAEEVGISSVDAPRMRAPKAR